jgi:hypothetical protein
MALDAYALCAAGTGKKIKFCCPDLLPELEKLDRMMEGEQFVAALQHIDRLLAQGKHRACLMSVKALLLRETDQFEAARANAAAFVERFPEDSVAWAELAMLTAMEEGGRAAMPKLLQAIALSEKRMLVRVYDAIGIVAAALAEEGDWFAARGLWHMQMTLMSDDQHPRQQLVRINRSHDLPLLMKSEPVPPVPPEDAPWLNRLREALKPLEALKWQKCAENLTALAQEFPDAPAIVGNLAIVRGWLADDEGAIDAWRKYAALYRGASSQLADTGPTSQPAHELSLEDAVEAEALAMMLSADPLGDAVQFLRMDWEVRDAERLQERLLSDHRVAQVPFDPAAMAAEDSPPPRFIGMILDKAPPESPECLTLDATPRMLGQALLFGKQTDREARLEIVGLTSWDSPAVKGIVREIGGEWIGPDPQEQVTGQASGSHQLLGARWYPPRGTTREQAAVLAAESQRRALSEKWPELPLGILGGRSPREASADPANYVRLLAATLVLDHWTERSTTDFDFNELRSRLGLPTLGPVDPEPMGIGRVPLVRLDRVIVEKLSDEDLLVALRRASLFGATAALRKFALAILDRPSFAQRPERLVAHQLLAQSAENIEQALAHVEEGRAATVAAGESCVAWDLMELPYCFMRGDGRRAMQLIQHIQGQHIEEPGVADALTRLLIEVGVLRPDGTPMPPPTRQQPGPVAMEEPAAEPGRLWTPDSGPAQGGGGKLWTPG